MPADPPPFTGEGDRRRRWRGRFRIGLLTIASATTLSIAAPALSAPSSEAILAKRPPKLLSEFGFFDDVASQRPSERVTPYDLATPLFSDHALKYRFVYVPQGLAVTYHPSEAFDFPVGSALIKTFAFPADFRAPDTDIRLIETRVLLKQETGWQAWAYRWNEAQTDAALTIAGARVPIAATLADGSPLAFNYSVPNKNQCKACHALFGEIAPLGPKARNLNRDFRYPDGARNQLAEWTQRGLLGGAPPPQDAERVPDSRDDSAPLDARARAWLDVNCAHCHRREGPASNSGLFLTWEEPAGPALGLGKRPVAAGRGSGGREFDIAPGEPDNSILLHRIESDEPGVMMPELGRHVRDPSAESLLREWITSLD